MRLSGCLSADLFRIDAARDAAPYATGSAQAALDDLQRAVSIGAAAHEDVDGSEASLRPGVDRDVRFGEQHHAGDAAAVSEGVEVREQHRRASLTRGVLQQRLKGGCVLQGRDRHAVQVGQQVNAARDVGNRHLWPPELQLPDPDDERQELPLPEPVLPLIIEPQDMIEHSSSTPMP